MDSQRLNELESQGDWGGLAAALTTCIDETSDANEQAAMHSRLGNVLAGKLLQAPVVLKHFQTAWKLRPASGGPLCTASQIYWELGKIKMVEMVLRKALECSEGIDRGKVLMDIGAACCDQAKYEEAKTAYEAAAEADNALEDEALALLVDLSATEDDFQARCDELRAEASEASGTGAMEVLLRAARIAVRYDEALFEDFALAAYRADCGSRQAAAVYEEYLLKKDRLAEVLNEQRNVLGEASVADGARIAFAFGKRWVTRHQNHDIGGRLLETAVLGDPENDVAFTFLKTQCVRKPESGIAFSSSRSRRPSGSPRRSFSPRLARSRG